MENKNWLSFDEILERWGAADFEFLPAFKENGLHPYHQGTGEKLSYDEDLFLIQRGGGRIAGFPSWFEAILKLRYNADLAGTAFQLMINNRSNPDVFFQEEFDFNNLLIQLFRDSQAVIKWKIADVETYEQQHGINQQGHAPEPLSINPGKDKKPSVTDPGAVAYYNFAKCGMDWIPTGEKAFPEKYKQYMSGNIPKETFRSHVRRSAERYANKNNLPLKKGPAPTR